jgi:uncharacterized membrane protein YeiB
MLDWIITHWKDILAIYGAVVLVCSTIVKLTPSQKDDNVWAKILKILDFFSTVFTKEDAEKLAAATKKSKK